MSEYWVSKKKYFCKYCDIYIADDAPSRQQHENGLRHKGNQERFVRGLYKEGERRKKDAEEEKREIARVEQVSSSLQSLLFEFIVFFRLPNVHTHRM
jgi:WW domain-binding protein 4